MKRKITAAEKRWNECAEYEATHEIAFASPRALPEARMIAEMDKARRPHHRAHRNGVARRLESRRASLLLHTSFGTTNGARSSRRES